MAKLTAAELKQQQIEQARTRGGADAVPLSESEQAINQIVAEIGASMTTASQTDSAAASSAYQSPNLSIDSGFVYTGKKKNTGQVYETDEKVSVVDKMNEYYNWTPKQNYAFVAKLRKLNYIGPNQKITEPQIAQVWKDAVNGAATYASATNGANKMTVDSYLSLYARNFPAATAKLPTKDITQFSPEVIDTVTNSIYQSAIGRKANPEELTARRKEIQAMINVGSTTTTTVKNGVNVRTTTPAFSKEEASAKITKDLKANVNTAPEAERRQAFEFNNLLNKAMSGGI